MGNISYNCPTCFHSLESPVEDAGKSTPCPRCGRDLIVPSSEKLDELRLRKAREIEMAAQREAKRNADDKARSEYTAEVNRVREELRTKEHHDQRDPDKWLKSASNSLNVCAVLIFMLGGLFILSAIVAPFVIGSTVALYSLCSAFFGIALIAGGFGLDMLAAIGLSCVNRNKQS